MAKKKKITINLTGLKIVTLHDTLTGKFHKAIDFDVSDDNPFIEGSEPLPDTIKVYKTKIIKPKKKNREGCQSKTLRHPSQSKILHRHNK